MSQPLTVFISSTCYDLHDLRQVLRADLELQGYMVTMSDDFESNFKVTKRQDSIKTCLDNVKASNVVVCIIDRRYGPPIKVYDNKSATQLEVEHAQANSILVLTYIRDRTLTELYSLGRDKNASCQWIDFGHGANTDLTRTRFMEFVESQRNLHAAKNSVPPRSNWFRPFSSALDLTKMVSAELGQYFPEQAAGRALRSDRLSRLHFVPQDAAKYFRSLPRGHFRNVTENVAYNIVHGCRSEEEVVLEWPRPALGHKENIGGANGQFEYPFTGPGIRGRSIFCEWENVFHDRYRIEIPILDGWVKADELNNDHLGWGVPSQRPIPKDAATIYVYQLGEERFFVQILAEDEPQWYEIQSNIRKPRLPELEPRGNVDRRSLLNEKGN